jgi:hypothetical protein
MRSDAPEIIDIVDNYSSLKKHSKTRDKWFVSRLGQVMPTEYIFEQPSNVQSPNYAIRTVKFKCDRAVQDGNLFKTSLKFNCEKYDVIAKLQLNSRVIYSHATLIGDNKQLRTIYIKKISAEVDHVEDYYDNGKELQFPFEMTGDVIRTYEEWTLKYNNFEIQFYFNRDPGNTYVDIDFLRYL